MKDARDIDIHDLETLRQILIETTHEQIIITHGYQTMADTMKFLQQMDRVDQSIVLVDALVPAAEDDSDA